MSHLQPEGTLKAQNDGETKMALQWFLTAVPLYLVLGWVATTWIRAKHGYPLPGGARRRDPRAQERDAELACLEARVRVLERIATDRPAQLRAELEALGANGTAERDAETARSYAKRRDYA